ncbi:probable tRNA (uracil-O(2)-)-methyltransferase [Ochotona princeps]|uniref:probable tRNA (uracil-O(2)-)-methyltransferase n=1 Tax=Ochotona princeps TaxID=9978 RepID=UPI00271476A5|nr:probable tRNA (uracil-O(2)-)-methyltransferase [Ochotona princeps]
MAPAEVGRVEVADPGSRLPGGFWEAAAVWLERPQVVNKRLCGARVEARRRALLPGAQACPGSRSEERDGAGREPGEEAQGRPLRAGDPAQSRDAAGRDADLAAAADLDALWEEFSASLASRQPDMLAFLGRPAAGAQPGARRELEVILRTVIPKAGPHGARAAPAKEMAVRDVACGAVSFFPLEEDGEGNLHVRRSSVYRLELRQSGQAWFISVLIFCPESWHSDGVVCPRPSWLGGTLLARLARWSVASKKRAFKDTLSLICVAKYSRTHQALREKYRALVKVWPEVTDPDKFVYEDVAIAAYLLVLWEEERAARGVTAKQSFVDLGCGNGLLTHILCSEGHPGRGVDVRRRKIWDLYGPQTRLEEEAISPSDKTLFPGVDWLIGNHSDELTPWIPVIAARSSYDCRFFVLPCCFFDFAGKYRRQHSQKTQYREYLDFVQEVGQTCGFHLQEDCLRIPSTKRVCLLGKSRTYPPTAEAAVDERRAQYIRSRRGCPPSPPALEPPPPPSHAPEASDPWLPGFRPREKAEPTRNCTSLPRDFVDRVVLQVASLLLRGRPLKPGGASSGNMQAWDTGESRSLAEVARVLDSETLRRLKRECGGLQTLLRNSHQVFQVLHGRVRIRDWREEGPPEGLRSGARRRQASEARKTRTCWFFSHHPDGCVLPAHRCPFAHGPEELRPPLTPRRKQQIP